MGLSFMNMLDLCQVYDPTSYIIHRAHVTDELLNVEQKQNPSSRSGDVKSKYVYTSTDRNTTLRNTFPYSEGEALKCIN
jgi:hypothetical protein